MKYKNLNHNKIFKAFPKKKKKLLKHRLRQCVSVSKKPYLKLEIAYEMAKVEEVYSSYFHLATIFQMFILLSESTDSYHRQKLVPDKSLSHLHIYLHLIIDKNWSKKHICLVIIILKLNLYIALSHTKLCNTQCQTE